MVCSAPPRKDVPMGQAKRILNDYGYKVLTLDSCRPTNGSISYSLTKVIQEEGGSRLLYWALSREEIKAAAQVLLSDSHLELRTALFSNPTDNEFQAFKATAITYVSERRRFKADQRAKVPRKPREKKTNYCY